MQYFLSLLTYYVLDSPVFTPACEHHHDTFPIGTGHLGDIAVDELMVLIHHKMFEVSRCQDSPFMAGCTVNSTGIYYLIPPGLVEDGHPWQLRLFREKYRRWEGGKKEMLLWNLNKNPTGSNS